MLSLDEAITHAREVAKEKYTEAMLCHANPNDEKLDGCIECAREHEQLAEWLQELKALKENSISKEAFEKMKSIAYKKGHRQGYNKALDDFAKALTTMYEKYDIDDVFESSDTYSYTSACYIFEHYIDETAEQLKAGVGNGIDNQQ